MVKLRLGFRICCHLFASAALAQMPDSAAMQSATEAVMAAHPSVLHGHVGYAVLDAETGITLLAHESDQFFAPASNAKLYTTAFALQTLGPDFRFSTRIETAGPWLSGVTKHVPDLRLIGGGDPDLSGRIIPYASLVPDRDPLSALRAMARSLANAGLELVDGDVIGSSVRYGGDPYPDGWTIDDSLYGYGAPVTDLVCNDNQVSLTIRPGTLNDLAAVRVEPELGTFIILNQVITVPGRTHDLHYWRPPGSNELVLWGRIGADASIYQEDLAVPDASLLAARALVEELRRQGVTVRGEAKGSYCPPNQEGTASSECSDTAAARSILTNHQSPPLSQVIQIINKVSQNLHAEMLLRNTALTQLGGSSTHTDAVTARGAFLHNGPLAAIPTSNPSIEDGSGLARQDLTTPQATVALLQNMWHSPNRDVWLQSLPIGGVDGSLAHRFRDTPGADRVHAKTGSLSHVSSLSGYLQTQGGRWLAFSVMVNGTTGNSSDVRDFLDAFCGMLLPL